MTTIRKLISAISAWTMALVGSLLLPLVTAAAVSGTTYDAADTTKSVSAPIVEHTESVGTVDYCSTCRRQNESGVKYSNRQFIYNLGNKFHEMIFW